MSTYKSFFGVVTLAVLAACATTGATLGSGVGDAALDRAPWYAGAQRTSVARVAAPITHLPIAFQRGASQPAAFDPPDNLGTPLGALLHAMNGWLDSAGVSTRAATRPRGVPPDVRFGCFPENGVPGNDCAERGDSALGRGRQFMQLTVGRPSTEWVSAVNESVDSTATQVLVITLEVGQYLVSQAGLRGTKRVDLGTAHEVDLPWLTSLETPVSVLQLTGALMDRRGKAVRIGAEGIYVRRTPLGISALRAQSLISDDDVRAAAVARRTDVVGAPLTWQSALKTLVEQLTGRQVAR